VAAIIELISEIDPRRPIYLPGSKNGTLAADVGPKKVEALYIPVTPDREFHLADTLMEIFGDTISLYASDSPPHVAGGSRMLNIGDRKARKGAALRQLLYR